MAIDEDTISEYFYLEKRIAKTYRRMAFFQEEFKSKNYYTSMQERYGEMRTVAFHVEREVINYITCNQMAEQHIKELEYKQKHFKRYWWGLHTTEQEYYLSRFKYHEPVINDRLDKEIMEEVTEIEEAVSHYFKKETLDYAIEKEDHFKKMMELLGV